MEVNVTSTSALLVIVAIILVLKCKYVITLFILLSIDSQKFESNLNF